MKQKLAIYLAGSIKKGHEKSDESYWTDDNLQFLRNQLAEFEVSYLNPAIRSDDLADPLSVFGRDMLQVFCSDVVFVDARDRRGLGVGAEMMWAKFNKIPVVCWVPKNSHYHKEHATILGVPVPNFIHPFVESLSDKIVEDLKEGAIWIKGISCSPEIEIKGIEHIEKAMKHYQSLRLAHDEPMQQVVNSHQELKSRMEDLTRYVQNSRNMEAV